MPILWRLEGIKWMIKPRFYLSGAMTDVDKNESIQWRRYLSSIFPGVFNPWEYWDVVDEYDNREVMNYDLNKLRKSDLVIVNFELNPKSIGTNMEIAIAHELRIPIIGFCVTEELHYWQRDMCEKIFDNWDDLINYVKFYYCD